MFVKFVALSVKIEVYCSQSSICTYTSERGLALFYVLAHVRAHGTAGGHFLAATNMTDVHFSSKFSFECRQTQGRERLVFESAFSEQVLVGAKNLFQSYTLAPLLLKTPKPTGEAKNVLWRLARWRCTFRISFTTLWKKRSMSDRDIFYRHRSMQCARAPYNASQ